VPILDLALGPITLDVLGLVVETSPICLNITAYDGGGLLGDLLCAVADLLDGGLSLDQILAGQSLLDPVTGLVLVTSLQRVLLRAPERIFAANGNSGTDGGADSVVLGRPARDAASGARCPNRRKEVRVLLSALP
jgi:hypothetical protein